MKAIKPSDFERIDVDITLHTKAIGYSSDARLGERVRERPVKAAHKEGVKTMSPPSACLARLRELDRAKRSKRLILSSRF